MAKEMVYGLHASIVTQRLRLNTDNMPKRKAKDLGLSEEPRRSSRRISTKPEDVAPEPTVEAPAPKRAKKESNKESNSSEEIATLANGKTDDGGDEVRTIVGLLAASSSLLPARGSHQTNQSHVTLQFYNEH